MIFVRGLVCQQNCTWCTHEAPKYEEDAAKECSQDACLDGRRKMSVVWDVCWSVGMWKSVGGSGEGASEKSGGGTNGETVG